MTAASSMPLGASTVSVMRNIRELLIKTITNTDKRFGESETVAHIQVMKTEFPKSATALDDALQQWLAELRQCQDSAPAATSLAEVPVLEAFCSAVTKINWQALLIVERSYPEIPIVEWQNEYAAYIRQEHAAISSSRTAAQSAYESMLNTLRDIALDEFEGILTPKEAVEKTVLTFEQGEASLSDCLF